MKKVVLFLILILFLQGVSAINLQVEKEIVEDVVIQELDKPAIFNLKIKNNGPEDNFEIYNLHGILMLPEEFSIEAGKTKEIRLMIYPRKDLDYGRFFQKYSFNYYIKGSEGPDFQDSVLIGITNIKNSFEIGVEEVNPDSREIDVYIKNKMDFDFGEITVNFSSGFFNAQEKFSLGKNERKDFLISLDRDKYKDLTSGFYTLKAEVFVENASGVVESQITFVEKNLVTESQKKFGIIVNTEVIETTNEGNTLATTKNSVNKNLISRLFTSFEPEPDLVEREGFSIVYSWESQLNPGESLRIVVKTNWLFPFLFLVLIVIVIAFLKYYSKKEITVRKKVSFIRAKGGEFALKVSIFIQANKYVERVGVVDGIPPLVKVFERYGSEKPSRIDEKNRRIDWNFDKLEAGEVRMLTYVIYSKVGIMGKFALPATSVIYGREGKIKEVRSNKTFFVAEQRKGDIQE
jgi:hypothetical protein